MCSAETAVYADSSATLAGSNKEITTSAGTGNVSVGDIVYVDSNEGSNAGYYKVTAVTSSVVTVEADANFTADASSVTMTRAARRLNGTVEDSFTIEVARLDLGIAQILRAAWSTRWTCRSRTRPSSRAR